MRLSSPRWLDACVVLGTLLAAVHYTYAVIWRTAQRAGGFPSYDIHAYSYPNFVYAHQALRRGYGLLWNDFQNCGQPFFGVISTALLYPPNWLFLLWDSYTVVFLQAIFNLALVGFGAYLLGRQIGLGFTGAVCGAVALEFSSAALSLANWNFALLAPYVWLPWAVLFCERILNTPSSRSAIALGLCLTLQLLAGFPQTQLFTYQLITLRLAWELATRRDWPRAQAASALVFAMALPALLGAIQLLPSLEVFSASVRNRALSPYEQMVSADWAALRQHAIWRWVGTGNLLPVVAVFIAAFAFTDRHKLRVACFYLACGSLYLFLAFDPRLATLYRMLPLGTLFRDANRLSWVASFALAILVGCGAHVLTVPARQSFAIRLLGTAVSLAAVIGLYFFYPTGFRPLERAILIPAWLASAGIFVLARGQSVLRPLLPIALYASLFIAGRQSFLKHVAGDSVFYARAKAFEYVAERRSDQDRMYQMGEHADFSIIAKSASLFAIPSLIDYEPQTSLDYTNVLVRLIKNTPMTSLNDYYYLLTLFPSNRPLLSLLAGRYLVVAGAPVAAVAAMKPPLELLWQGGDARVYENHSALPRAFYVPRASVIRDRGVLLEGLASPVHRPGEVALIEEEPSDGFLGLDTVGWGQAKIFVSRGESLVVSVAASQAGFLFVSDQYFPGWEATVNGEPIPIIRANYAFRLVRVPQGPSVVAFHYRPRSLRIGALVSAITAIALLGYLLSGRLIGWRMRGRRE